MIKEILILLFLVVKELLNFYPVKYSVNDYFVASLSYNLDDNLLSTGSTVIGPSLVDSESVTNRNWGCIYDHCWYCKHL